MADPEKPIDSRILVDALDELKGVGREGMRHPSTKPLIVGGAIGAVVGALLPFVPFGLGMVVGVGFVLYKRIRP